MKTQTKYFMPPLIAWRNLTHDRARFAVALVGIVFSVILMGMQMGLLLNFISTTTTVTRHSKADIFITAPGVKSADMSTPQTERRRFQALGVDGVEKAESLVLDFGMWKRPDGVVEMVSLVGVAPDAAMGLPWDMEDSADPRPLLKQPDGIIIDRLYADKLGVTHTGQMVEINSVRARVVGFTSRIRTFTQSPFVFTSLSGARRMMGMGDQHISYVLIKAAKGHKIEDVRDRLQKKLPDTTVITAEDFGNNSANYWLFTTGAGVSLIMGVILGLCVGGVIVAQTLYASTMDRLPEYATLRAIGGPAVYLYRVVLTQAALAGVIGYVLGMIVVGFIVWSGRNASAAPEMPPWLAVTIALSTLAVCLLAAAISLRVVTKIDPVKVFR